MNRFLIPLFLAVSISLGGCATVAGIFGYHVSERTRAGAEVGLTVVVKVADEYTVCGKPGNLPCPNGAEKSDLAVVNELYAKIKAAKAAVNRLRDGTGTLDAAYAAIAAVEAYEAEKGLTQ